MTVVDFFFDLFSTISNFPIFPTTVVQRASSEKSRGPGASEKPFGPSKGDPGGHFGPSRGVREGILGAPEGSGEQLGAVLGGLGAILERLFEQSDFGLIF